MRALPVAIVVLLVAIATVPVTRGINPTDDDAGSGGDAGDRRDAALTVLLGTYRGRLTGSVDGVDYYRFNLSSSVLLEIAFDRSVDSARGCDGELRLERPDGTPYAWFGLNETRPVPVPTSGTWYLRADLQGCEASLSYLFSIDTRPAYDIQVLEFASDGATGELAWNGSAEVYAYAWAWSSNRSDGRGGHDAQEPGALANAAEFYSNGTNPPWHVRAFILHAPGTGTTVGTEPEVAPELTVDVAPVTSDGLGIASWTHIQPGLGFFETGSARFMTYSTFEASRGSLVFAIKGNVTSRMAMADQVVDWNTENAPADRQVLAPGASYTGPRNRTLEVEGYFSGFFSPRSSWKVTDPLGNTADGSCFSVPVSTCDWEWLFGLTEGNWRFEVERSHGVGPYAADGLLDGIFVPELGLAPRHDLALDSVFLV